MECNPTLTLAIVWQLMRAYTLALLSRLGAGAETLVTETEIVDWANRRAGLDIKNFQDRSIRSSLPILKLINTLQPGTVDWSLVAEQAGRIILFNPAFLYTIHMYSNSCQHFCKIFTHD